MTNTLALCMSIRRAMFTSWYMFHVKILTCRSNISVTLSYCCPKLCINLEMEHSTKQAQEVVMKHRTSYCNYYNLTCRTQQNSNTSTVICIFIHVRLVPHDVVLHYKCLCILLCNVLSVAWVSGLFIIDGHFGVLYLYSPHLRKHASKTY